MTRSMGGPARLSKSIASSVVPARRTTKSRRFKTASMGWVLFNSLSRITAVFIVDPFAACVPDSPREDFALGRHREGSLRRNISSWDYYDLPCRRRWSTQIATHGDTGRIQKLSRVKKRILSDSLDSEKCMQ